MSIVTFSAEYGNFAQCIPLKCIHYFIMTFLISIMDMSAEGTH